MTELPQPTVNDPVFGNRDDYFRIDLLDLNNEFIEELAWSDGNKVGVLPGGSLEFSNATDTRETAKLTIVKDLSESIPWQSYRLRISYIGAGYTDPQPLSTLVPTAAPERHPSSHVVEELELHGMLTILLRSKLTTTEGIAQGTNITDWIGDVIYNAGIEDFEVEHSNRVMASSLSWEPNTTRLRVVNDLLDIIGYWAVNTDPEGRVVARSRTPFSERPVAWVFDDHPLTGLYLPDWSRDRDLLVPNRCTVYQRTEGDWPPLQPIKAELPPEHPLSFESIGYHNDRVEFDVNFADEESGYIKALEYLHEGIPTESRTFKHPWVPGLVPGVRVVPNAKVIHQREGLPDLIAPVQRQTYSLTTGGLVETRISGTSE